MQTALDIRTFVAPARTRPALLARHNEGLPVRPVAQVSAFKRVAGLADTGARYEAQRQDEVLERDQTPSRTVAVIRGPIAAPIPSSPFLAQHIAQEGYGESRPSRAENEASLEAYRAAAERGAVFLGIEYPVDFSV